MTATQIPSELVAGDSWSWTRELPDYPAPTWTATVYFESTHGNFNAPATASGMAHAFSILAATTGTKKAGDYRWSVRVTDGSEVVTAESGWVKVLANPAASGTSDPRSWARRTLEAVEATLEGRATDGQLAHTIKDRSVSRIPVPELMQIRDRLRQEVKTEEAGSNAGLGRIMKTRFSRG